MLREEVVPLYDQRDREGLRMVMDYTLKCYVPAVGGVSIDPTRKVLIEPLETEEPVGDL